MRWFLIPAVATAALVLSDPAPAKAQIIVVGNPTYNPRYSGPFVQFPRLLAPAPAPAPVTPAPIPYYNGSPLELALDSTLRSAGMSGYGPYAGNPTLFADPRYFGGAYPANYSPWTAVRPYNPPAPNLKWVDPRPVNTGLPKGWLNGGGKGVGKGVGKGGKGR